MSCRFPPDFKRGVATAAYQTEGALDADGCTPSVWDTFSTDGANVADGSTAAIGTDSYHRYGEDVALIQDGGMNAYRFSIAWSRIMPDGAGPMSPKVLITENGCSDAFGKTAPAIQDDSFRIDYLHRHLQVVKAAMEAGSPIGGYFARSLIDNWEWDHGFTSKFGLVSQAGRGGTRAPKDSYTWFKALAESGMLAVSE